MTFPAPSAAARGAPRIPAAAALGSTAMPGASGSPGGVWAPRDEPGVSVNPTGAPRSLRGAALPR